MLPDILGIAAALAWIAWGAFHSLRWWKTRHQRRAIRTLEMLQRQIRATEIADGLRGDLE